MNVFLMSLVTLIFFVFPPVGNTVSNLIMIIPPIFGAVQSIRDGLEKRYIAAYLALMGT